MTSVSANLPKDSPSHNEGRRLDWRANPSGKVRESSSYHLDLKIGFESILWAAQGSLYLYILIALGPFAILTN
jgi:hypothetical protein